MNSVDLSQLSLKELKGYIQAYNLPSKMAIEKDDLVRIIFNTRPLSNENESFYRRFLQPSPTTAHEEHNHSFSFGSMLQDILSPPLPSTRPTSRPSSQAPFYRPPPPTTAYRPSPPPPPPPPPAAAAAAPTPYRPPSSTAQPRPASTQPMSAPSRPKSNSPAPSLQQIIQSKTDINTLSVRTLKSILKANFVEQSHVIEKSELVKLVYRLTEQEKKQQAPNEDSLCRICLDAEQNCVFLNCGHMATCMECAKLLIDSKNECPICREPILKLVHVFRS